MLEGFSNWRQLIWVYVAIALIVALLHAPSLITAYAQDHDGHAEFHDVYKEWMRPQPHESLRCCNAKYDDDGNLRDGDCYATEFRLVDGRRWVAKLDKPDAARLGREWIDVPDKIIIRERNPDPTGSRGHICVSKYTIENALLCAVPPTGGS